jgi:tRNA threonylcarbamoyladenosine modification (KEOPS) complex  Pcc1 subunit
LIINSELGVVAVKTSATIRLKLPTEEKLRTVLNSLNPEANNPATTRSRTTLYKKKGSLVLRVEADDTVALRASLNAYLRWINSIMNVFEVLEAQ